MRARELSRTDQSTLALPAPARPAPGRSAQHLVAHDLHSRVVGLERVVERQLVVVEAQLLAALARRLDALGELDQLLDCLFRRDRAVVVLLDRVREHLRERARLDQIPPRARLDLVAASAC